MSRNLWSSSRLSRSLWKSRLSLISSGASLYCCLSSWITELRSAACRWRSSLAFFLSASVMSPSGCNGFIFWLTNKQEKEKNFYKLAITIPPPTQKTPTTTKKNLTKNPKAVLKYFIKQTGNITIMHWGNLWWYIFLATRVGCFLFWSCLVLCFVFRLRFTELQKNKQAFIFPTNTGSWCLDACVYSLIMWLEKKEPEPSCYSGLTLLTRFSGLGRSCSGSFSAEINKSIRHGYAYHKWINANLAVHWIWYASFQSKLS